MTNKFSALWTAKGNNLCLGHWEIAYSGKPLALPAKRRQDDMGTYNIYSYIDPDDEEFAEGLQEDAWIIANAGWLAEVFLAHDIPFDEQHLSDFYRAVNAQDWRCGSCGGCI